MTRHHLLADLEGWVAREGFRRAPLQWAMKLNRRAVSDEFSATAATQNNQRALTAFQILNQAFKEAGVVLMNYRFRGTNWIGIEDRKHLGERAARQILTSWLSARYDAQIRDRIALSEAIDA